MRQKPDILERRELKNMPFSTPEGYFDAKVVELSKISESPKAVIKRFKPVQYISAAATIAIIVASGLFYSNKPSSYEEDYENMLFYLSSNTEDIGNYFSENIETELTDEDIIAYLIDSGANIENLTNE
jgi:hypothetical protein